MPHPLLPPLCEFNLDQAITMVEVAQRVRAPQGGRLNIAVVWRWTTWGYTCRYWHGEPLILPTVMIGRRRYTMPQWLSAFERARVEMGSRTTTARTPQRTDRQSAAAHRRAVKSLEKAGFSVGGTK